MAALEQPGLRHDVDLTTHPAAFYVMEAEAACEYEKPCGRRPRVDPATGLLTD